MAKSFPRRSFVIYLFTIGRESLVRTQSVRMFPKGVYFRKMGVLCVPPSMGKYLLLWFRVPSIHCSDSNTSTIQSRS